MHVYADTVSKQAFVGSSKLCVYVYSKGRNPHRQTSWKLVGN